MRSPQNHRDSTLTALHFLIDKNISLLPEKSTVKLTVNNMLGERIATLVNHQLKEGFYEYEFDASDLTSGTYIYRLETNQFSSAKKLMLVK